MTAAATMTAAAAAAAPTPLRSRLTPFGVGTARGAEDDATDERLADVLRESLRLGVRVLDTAVNYRSGRSERVVGRVVREATSTGDLRDRIVVCTKAGYPRPSGGIAPPSPAPERHQPRDHCLAPDCLRHSIDTSLATLGLDRVDVLLLHNVERLDSGSGRPLHAAVEVLEAAADDGLLAGYGYSTWDLSSGPTADPAGFAAVVREVAGSAHRFVAVEAPLSLARQQALAPRYGATVAMSLPRACAALGVAFLASAAAGEGSAPSLAAASARWAAGLPDVSTALVGTLDVDHLRAVAAGASRA